MNPVPEDKPRPYRPYLVALHVLSQKLDRYISPSVSVLWPPLPDSADIRAWPLAAWQDLCAGFLPSLADQVNEKAREKLLASRPLAQLIHQHVTAIGGLGGDIVAIGDPLYPPLLEHIASPPIALSCLGNLKRLSDPCLAVVGSRRPSYEVLQACFELGHLLAAAGTTVVSGGAFGVDIRVHQGVAAAAPQDLRAIIVFATGLTQLYPRSNLKFFREVIQHGGLLVSERLFDTVARPYDFPTRNRIISGMVKETVVMQAHENSGTLTTARWALDQGREVLVFRSQSPAQGSEQLIEDGAPHFASAAELAQALGGERC